MRNRKLIKENKNKLKGYKKLLEDDFDWDYNYLLILMLHKMKRMEYNIRKNGNHVGSERTAKQIKICILLLDRIIEDNYISEEYSKLLDEWGPFRNSIPIKNAEGEVIAHRVPDSPPALEKAMRRESARTKYMEKQDWDYLFKLMHKYMKHWWD